MMRKSEWFVHVSRFTVFVLLFILVFVEMEWPLRFLLGTLLAISSYVCLRALRFSNEEKWNREMLRQKEEQEKVFIDLTDQARHNWLNELQVLFGYIRLNNIEKLQHALETIKESAQQEHNISRLGVNELSAYLIIHRLKKDKLELEVKLNEVIDLRKLAFRTDEVCSVIKQLIERFYTYSENVALEEPNKLIVSIQSAEDALRLHYRYSGVANMSALRESVQNVLLRYALDIQVEQQRFEENTAELKLLAPFKQETASLY